MARKDSTFEIEEIASFICQRQKELIEISNSGYGLSWFANCFYRYWHTLNHPNGIELWGNMGGHYTSQRTWQFSEVMVTQENDYQRDIFIQAVIGKESSAIGELVAVQQYLESSNRQFPRSLVLVGLEDLDSSREDPISARPKLLFPQVQWTTSFEATLFSKHRRVTVGLFDGHLEFRSWNKF